MSELRMFTFAVYNLDPDPPFEAFLIDVPSIDGDEDRAARRAWWTVFHKLGAQGIEPEQFSVACWYDGAPGPLVGMSGRLA